MGFAAGAMASLSQAEPAAESRFPPHVLLGNSLARG
jgi:hypothetical protein